jgi:formylmethanofuran dehydrogenase subunit B
MLRKKNKFTKNCIFRSNFEIGYQNFINNGKSVQNLSKSTYPKNFLLDAKPSVFGKTVDLDTAILEIKRIINKSDQIHLTGMDCDISSIDNILGFAEKLKCSLDHMDGEKISNLYQSIQRNGGSFVSFNEMKNRSDLLIFLGISENELSEKFFKKIQWNKKKTQKSIFFLSENKSSNFKYIQFDKNYTLENLNNLGLCLSGKKKINKEFVELEKTFYQSKYPVVLLNIKKNNSNFISLAYDCISLINKKKRLKTFNFFGSNNSAGFINSCVTKTGFPNSIIFTDNGAEYDPYEIKTDILKNHVDTQIYFSQFNTSPEVHLFKRNIYIGHPNFYYKKQFDVYIPVKIPNIDSQGLVVRPDGLGVEKLDKKIESNYKTINEILSLIDD